MSLLTSLVAYWKLDEASGNALDAYGASTLAETSGTIDSASGKVGNARDFEIADSEYFTIPDNYDLSTGDIDFTIQAWVNIESKSASYNAILGKWSSGQNEYLLYYDGSLASPTDRFKFAVSSSGSAATGTVSATTLGSPSTGTWYCIHAWHDSVNNVLGISVNAGTADTTSYSSGVRDGTAGFTIGRNDEDPLATTSSYWDGLIDEVGFWKKVLTSDERTSLYNGGSGLAFPFGVNEVYYVAGSFDSVTSTSDTSIVVTAPSGSGGTLYAIGGCNDARTISPPAGWTQVSNDAANSQRVYLWWRQDDAAGSYTFTVSGTFSGATVSIHRVANASTNTPSASLSSGTNSTAQTCPTVTPATSPSLLLWLLYHDGTSGAYSASKGAERIDTSGPGQAVYSSVITGTTSTTGATIYSAGYGIKRVGTVVIASAAGATAKPFMPSRKTRIFRRNP